MTLACGIDVGGTKIAGAVLDEDGTVVEFAKVQSPADEAEAIEDAIAALVTDLASRHEFTQVGVGAAGYINADRSEIMFAPNLAWRDVPMRAELEARIDKTFVIENDANVAAWGEFRYGAGEDVDDLLMITVGTGVGGGLVHAGELYRGGFGVAGEIGHLRVVPGGRRCGCGNLGCLEQYASGTALQRQAQETARQDPAACRDLLERAGGDIEAITGSMVTDAARDGESFAMGLFAELGRWLGEGLASMTAVLDPSVIVIGGGVGDAGDLLLVPTREAFDNEVTGRGYRPIAELRLATLGNRAGVIGAADLARR